MVMIFYISHKSINYSDKNDSYIYGYRSSFKTNNNQIISITTHVKNNYWI